MLTVKPAKSMKGTWQLPPSPDLFVLATILSLCSRRAIQVAPFTDTPMIRQWIDTLKGLAQFEQVEGAWKITPVTEDPSQFINISTPFIPYRDLVIFSLLGMGKTIAFSFISNKRLESWKERAKRYGIEIGIDSYDGKPGFSIINRPDEFAISKLHNENDLSLLLGLASGLNGTLSFLISFPFSNPLRTIASIYGFDITVKSTIEKENDPMARRIKLLQKKPVVSNGMQYLFSADFHRKEADSAVIPVTLPGDEILSAILLTARCLIQKGSFVLGNIPLETWSAPVLNFIRKMGTKVTAQETGRTSFGSTGLLTTQKIELTGRKIDCKPLSSYEHFLPPLVILAAFAQGQSVFRGLEDLRNDEPDGIDLLESCIRRLGARHGEMPDGIVTEGGKDFDGFDFDTPFSAELSAAFAIAGLHCVGTTTINDEYLLQRWPDFETILSTLFESRS
ncbi:MAG TPA: hypothetical protein VHO70_04430 [Chitinispirillaceae bacterium]|nr:hypothetical protein [Chitinispirillaceae bacterium]